MSENHAIVGASYNAGVWTTDLSTENWSAAVDTRSLSYILIPDLNTTDFSNSNLALLFYENPTTKISLLLQQSRWLDGHASALTEWVDITGPFHESDTYPFSTPFIYTANLTGSGSHSLVFYTPGAPGDEAMIRSTYIAQVRPSVPGSNPNVSFFDAGKHCAYPNS